VDTEGLRWTKVDGKTVSEAMLHLTCFVNENCIGLRADLGTPDLGCLQWS
jgi:hypothetical protein